MCTSGRFKKKKESLTSLKLYPIHYFVRNRKKSENRFFLVQDLSFLTNPGTPEVKSSLRNKGPLGSAASLLKVI